MSEPLETTTTDAEVVTDTNTDTSELSKQLEHFKLDNHKQREELRKLKATLKELTDAKSVLEAEKADWAASLEQRKLEERDKLVTDGLAKANITEEANQKLARRLLADVEDVEEGIKSILAEYPFIAVKATVKLPDTGKAVTLDTPVADKDKLATGLARLISK